MARLPVRMCDAVALTLLDLHQAKIESAAYVCWIVLRVFNSDEARNTTISTLQRPSLLLPVCFARKHACKLAARHDFELGDHQRTPRPAFSFFPELMQMASLQHRSTV